MMGSGVVVAGYALMLIALARQAERATASAPVPACVPTDTVARGSVPSPTSTLAASVTTASNGVAANESAPPSTGSASAASPAAPIASGDVPTDADNRIFKFSPGGATMSREEVLKMLALGKALARHPAAKVSIEGYGDLAGTDPLMMGIAKHRAKVGQTLLSKAGVPEDHVTLTFSDMGSDQRLARSIRVTTTPPISEVEKP